MPANQSSFYTSNMIISDPVGSAAAPGPHFGFQRTGIAVIASGPRVIPLTDSPNGVLAAPAGSLAQVTSGQLWLNTDGATTWIRLV